MVSIMSTDSLQTGGPFANENEQIAKATQAIREDPSNAWAYCERGRAYLDDPSKQDQALADFDEAIRLDPNLARAYNGRGLVHKNRGDSDRSISEYNEALRRDRSLFQAWNNRGIAYRERRLFELALADLQEAIRLNPNAAAPYVNRGLVYRDMGKPELALAGLRPSHQPGPDAAARLCQSRRDPPPARGLRVPWPITPRSYGFSPRTARCTWPAPWLKSAGASITRPLQTTAPPCASTLTTRSRYTTEAQRTPIFTTTPQPSMTTRPLLA